MDDGRGGFGLNHAELQRMTEERTRDAEVLLAGGRWAFAYYVAGYAVECALKACLLKRMVLTGWVFERERETGR
ncbi:MAG: HEPN domain-containing protein [Paludisphaera borealis]|uniref:HEPN domain-containing protein n=1 Tax=Paludisphaera borealis TaxID=1387353 RepID=UPI00284E1C9A|nr:HEPN domain-containing protein [Paludisphaera borealis]MDR3622408.1 HEPN domain-containing protein [Paludisphaera borealis]